MTFPASTHAGRLHIDSRHLPAAKGGGGDIHDAMATPFGIRLLIGDVMGTGPAANRAGLAVLNAWRELACTEPRLTDIAVSLHTLIATSDAPERFVTALLANFPLATDNAGPRAELVCCGHPPALLLRDGTTTFTEPHVAPPLGLLDLDGGQMGGGPCQVSMLPVGPGDQLLLYTDGISDARDTAGRFFPLAERTAQHAAGPALLDALMAALAAHVGDRVNDDTLLLLVTLALPAGALRGVGTLLSPGRGRAPQRA
jgi:serine phosphatase RsbU (regulator of sigma subunit)